MASPFDFSSFLLTPPIPTPGSSGNGYDSRSDASGLQGNLPYGMHGLQQHSGADPPNPYQHDTGQRVTYQHTQQHTDTLQSGSSQLQPSSYHQSHAQSGSGGGNTQSADAGNSAKQPTLDERDYGLDPSAFSSVSFAMPSFLVAASSSSGQFEGETNVVDPSA